MITGTSMTENFKASELDEMFSGKSIKVPYSGGTFKEIDESVQLAINCNKDLKMVVRGLDCMRFTNDSELMRTDMGDYPTYLYDNNIFNDIEYFASGFNETIKIIFRSLRGAKQFSFDEYSRWHDLFKYGKDSVQTSPITNVPKSTRKMSQEERERMKKNIDKNVVKTIKDNPNVNFCYFFTPYSALYWRIMLLEDTLDVQIESERYIIEQLINLPNVSLVSLNDCFDITTNLNFYRDWIHYGDWINSFVLRCFKENRHVLNKSNYEIYLTNLRDFYWNYDFSEMNNYEDIKDDEGAKTILEELIKQGKI